MRLISLDVDRCGTNDRYQVGPMSSGLNAVSGAKGSGKTTLLHWLRMISEHRFENASGGYLQVANHDKGLALAGQVDVENRGYQYRVTTDRNGRIRFDWIGGSVYQHPASHNGFAKTTRWDGRVDGQVGQTNLSDLQRDAFVGLASASGTADTQAGLVRLADRLGMNQRQVETYTERERLATRARELEQLLGRADSVSSSREQLLARQRQLESELATSRENGQAMRYEGLEVDRRRIWERNSAIETELQQVLEEISSLDREIASCETQLNAAAAAPATAKVPISYRQQLQQLDDRLNRWRQTLRDLREHRETIDYNATDARLDKQIGDQLSNSKSADPRAAMRSLESQIMSTRQQLDLLVERYDQIPGYDYRSASAAVAGTGMRPNEVPHTHGVYRDATGKTFVGHPGYLPEASGLPETLRSMQKDLQDICQQLARHESHSLTESLKQQAAQLQRCENELLQSVEQLVVERAALLQRIASEHHLSIEQLTLAFGEWCQCHDHPHLMDWLLSEESRQPEQREELPGQDRRALMEQIERLRQQRKSAGVRADASRRQIRDADLYRREVVATKAGPSNRPEVEILRELDQVVQDLHSVGQKQQIASELDQIQQQLRHLPGEANSQRSVFEQAVDRHIEALMGPADMSASYDRRIPLETRYDLVDGPKYTTRLQSSDRRMVPDAIIRVAMRLAIVELLRERGEPVSLVIDESLDALSNDLQRYAIQHLAQVSHQQQVIILTGDADVADLVKMEHGWVGYLRPSRRTIDDPNRHLAALANDHEADKWYQPVISEPDNRGHHNGFYLSEDSLIEDLPAIDPDLAVRCRKCGVDRIGDLLDVDAVWLARELRVTGISADSVQDWQDVALLLCSVRKLRPFDARVLVGAGIRTPDQLAGMHPSRLMDRVERFLATSLGRRILRSGNSYELSRITSWIASAKGSVPNLFEGSSRADAVRMRSRYSRERLSAVGESSDSRRRRRRKQRRSSSDRNGERSAWSQRSRERDDFDNGEDAAGDYEQSNSRDSRRSRRSERPSYRVVQRSGKRRSSSYERHGDSVRASHDERATNEASASKRVVEATETELRFYLELESPVVDAPSIGPRMAGRLEEVGIETVEQLLAADAESLAEELDYRRADAETIVAWQAQATLVCRIPNLRGHDAQLLVACEITSPEDLSSMDPEDVLAQVTEVAESKEGQRILRGGKQPDLEEVSDWISWAGQNRRLNAA